MQIRTFFVFVLTLADTALAVIPNEPCKSDPWLDGKITNPASKLRLNSNGIDLASSLASENVTNFIKNIRVPDVQVFDITVFNVRVSRFENANFYRKLIRPNTIRWGFDRAHLTVSSGYKRKIRNLQTQALQTVEANATVASGLASMETTMSMFRDGDGRPVISSTSCTAKLGAANVTSVGNPALTSLLDANKLFVINEIEKMFQRLVCATTSITMKDNINKVLKTYPATIKFGGLQNGFRSVGNNLLVLEYGLTNNPEVVDNDKAIEGMPKGTFYCRFSTVYPFYPPAITETKDSRYMLDFYATDYVFNTLLYIAFKEKLLKIEATSKTLSPSVANYLALSCAAGSVCVGNLFPNASNAGNANSYAKVCVHATKSPKATFVNGDAYWTSQASMELDLVDDKNKTTKLFKANSVCMFGSLTPNIDKSTLYAGIKVTGMPFSDTVSPTKDLQSDDLKKLQTIFVAITEEIVNGILSIGFPLPLVNGVSLVNPSVKLLPRTLYVGSNFSYSPNL